MKKKIIILTASYWAGHNIAANSLETFYLEKWYQVIKVDLIDFFNEFIWKKTQSFYEDFCEKFPKIWEKTFDFLDQKITTKLLFLLKYWPSQNKFNKLIKEEKPDLVVSVFPFWGGFIKNNIKKHWKNYKTGVIITDSISIHSVWYLKWDFIDKYFVIDKYSKDAFIEKFNHQQDNVVVSFFPIEENIFINKKVVNSKSIYLLLTSLKEEFVFWFLEKFADTDYKINIIAWRNNTLYKKTKKYYWDYQNFIFKDFLMFKENYTKMWIFVWKPWWATVSECIATSTPMIVPSFIPWQEEWNIELLINSNTWIYEPNFKNVEFLIKYVNWKELLPNFKEIKNKKSLKTIFKNLSDLK